MSWWRPQGLLVTIPMIVIVGGAAICTFDYLNARYMMLRDVDQQTQQLLRVQAGHAATYVAETAAQGEPERGRQALEQFSRLRPHLRLAVADSAGRPLLTLEPTSPQGSGLLRIDPGVAARALLPADSIASSHSPDHVTSALAAIPGGWFGQPAHLLVQWDTQPDLARLDRALIVEMLLNMLLVLALSGMLILLLRDKVLLPTSRLAAAAERIAAGDRTARVNIHGHDEIGRAAQAFDHMAETIARTEQALEAERRKVTAVLEALPVGLTLVDRHTEKLVFANAKWRELFGLDIPPGGDIRLRLETTTRHRENGAPILYNELAAPQVLRTGRATTVSDVVHIRDDGTAIPCVIHAVPVRLERGSDFDAVVSVTLDRREFVALLDEVRSWERRYEKVALATGQVVFEWDLVRRKVRRSGNFVGVLGYETLPDLDSEWSFWIERVHPDDRERVGRYLASVLESGEPFDEEYRFRHGDGRWITLRDRGFFEFEDGRPVRMYGTMDDVTEQRVLEEQFRQAQKMETVGTLAGGIAHDFNNALTGIIGHLALVSDEIPTDDARAQHIRIARRAAERCADLTRGLLAFSRQLESHPRPTDLDRLVHESVELLRRMLPSTVLIEAAAEPGLPPALVDPVQAQQVLFNLCVNARDAMPQGGRIRIGVRAASVASGPARHPDARPGRHVEIAVTDTGEGIPAPHLSRIFEPFFTTKPAGEGTGLGLSMAYGIVRKHHGWIEVDSAPQRGTTFRVYLPVAEEAVAERTAEPARVRAQARGETILVADDDVMVRELATLALTRAGYQVLEAEDGEAALRLVGRHLPHLSLVVLDLVMPGRTGGEVLRELQRVAPGLPVVISSGFTPSESPQLEGAAAFLPKPWTPGELLETVRAALGAPAA